MTSGNSQTCPGPQCPCLHRDGLNSPAVLRIRGRGSRLGVSRGPRREALLGCDGAAPRGSSAWSRAWMTVMAGAEGPRMRLPGSREQEGVASPGRRLGAAQRAEGEGARALPETGSEVLGTQRGTRLHTGPLSTANSSSGKCEP